MLLKGPWNWILDMLSRGPMDLNFGRAYQRSDGIEVGRASQRSDGLILDGLSRGTMDLILDVLPRCPLKFERASQRSDGFGEGDIYASVWVLYPSSCKINIFNL